MSNFEWALVGGVVILLSVAGMWRSAALTFLRQVRQLTKTVELATVHPTVITINGVSYKVTAVRLPKEEIERLEARGMLVEIE